MSTQSSLPESMASMVIMEFSTKSTESAFPSDRSTNAISMRPMSNVETIPELGNLDAPARPELRPSEVQRPRDASLPALLDFMRWIIYTTHGRAGLERYIVDVGQPVRGGLCSVHCQCATFFGKAVSATFYAAETDVKRQHNIFRLNTLKDFCVDILDLLPEVEYCDAEMGLTFLRPTCIITEHTQPVDDVLRGLRDFPRNFTIMAIGHQLAAQLTKLHKRRVVHCFVARSNVVQLPNSTRASWTLREYACAVPEGQSIAQACYSNVRLFAPEAGNALRRGVPVVARPAMDVWQLGVLLFELFANGRYWPPGETHDQVVTALNRSLPHERDPSVLNQISQAGAMLREVEFLITRCLARDPAQRPTMADVSEKFGEWAAQAMSTHGTFTMMSAQHDVVLESTIPIQRHAA